MRILLFLSILFNYTLILGQNTYLIANAQINQMFDESTFPSAVDFHFSSRASIGALTPIYFDSIAHKEVLSLEFAYGKMFNSVYFKNLDDEYGSSSGTINAVDGLFLKVEPYFNFIHNKARTLFVHASFNNLLYLFDEYAISSSYFDRYGNDLTLITANAENNVQYAFEPYLGVSYLLKFKNKGGLLFRLKRGVVFHNQNIAIMGMSNSSEVSAIQLNNKSWLFSIGYLLSDNKGSN